MRGKETKRMKGRLQRMECFRRPWLSERKGKFSYRDSGWPAGVAVPAVPAVSATATASTASTV